MASPHALVIPYPCQGHVIPLMELSHNLLGHGIKITFVNTEFNHRQVLASMPPRVTNIHDTMNFVSVPDGLGPGDDHNDLGKLCEGSLSVMPGYIEEIVRKSDESKFGRITWMIADNSMGWALDVAKKMGIRAAAFCPPAAALLATMLSIPKLVEDGILDQDGWPERREMIELSPGMPPMDTTQFSWNNAGDSKTQKIVYHYVQNNNRALKLAEFVICNTFYELESPVFSYAPDLLPIGPLTADENLEKPVGTFWPENESCIDWLGEQPENSVIYVAFGSLTILERDQFEEIALGLQLTGRPFLWVVRPDLVTNRNNDPYPNGFRECVAERGMIVDWSPQQKVLAHPSVACFFSHCGWNSTIEGVRNGVPFLCRPYFCDQFLNQNYICDVWRTGLRMDPDESGRMLKEEIKEKVERLLGDEDIKARALRLKELAKKSVSEGGSSYKNFNKFVRAMKMATP